MDIRQRMIDMFNNIVKDDKISRRVERGVYNYTIEKADTNQITKQWTNNIFKQIYIDKCRSIYTNLDKKSKTVIFSGVMYYHRVLDILLNAVPTVVKKIPEVKFVLLGDGPELNNLKKIVLIVSLPI